MNQKLRLLLALLCALSARLEAADAKKPNIVFFLIDDLGYADCGFNGGREIQTPNIDKLAREGTILDSLYVQPVCSPTRAALMTGRYATRTGVYTIVRPHATWGLPLGERTLANALHDAGYETAITGKWHLGEFDPRYLPTARGFDHQYGLFFGMIDYFTHMRGQWHDWHRDDKEVQEEGYTTHLISREACRLIAERQSRAERDSLPREAPSAGAEAHGNSKPLFLYVPFNGVHSPLQVPDEYVKPYPSLKGGRQKLAGMLSAVDEAIGQIVTAIDKAGMRDNTLIIFSTDNGGARPGDNTPLRAGKGTVYEGGVRGCAFVNWPGRVPANAHMKEMMHTVDWYPTLVKLAGGSLEQKTPLDGRDAWPMLTQGAPSPHDAILSVQSPERAAVRIGDWKLLMNAGEAGSEERPAAGAKPKGKRKGAVTGEHFELYNLARDIGERTNLADMEPERVAQMRTKLAGMLKGAVPPGQLNHEEGAIGAPASQKAQK